MYVSTFVTYVKKNKMANLIHIYSSMQIYLTYNACENINIRLYMFIYV